jgi:hypothetical protein
VRAILIFALALLACALLPKGATAEYSETQCASLHNHLYEEVHKDKKASNKKIISLARENLGFCHEHMNRDFYFANLRLLALNLNSDKQYMEALDVTNRCLEINATELFCLAQKADALIHLGRIAEATYR